ncbi:unnamed protein product [Closterium sp. NIES-65]|nr:unnamed protein product [Closterium sp. NIES-65]
MSRFRLPAVGWLLWRSVAAAVAGLVLITRTNAQGDAGLEHVMSLYRAWEAAYGLQADSPLPPSAIALPPRVPPPPHLEDCVALTAWRWAQEQWEAGEGGEGGKSGSGGEAGDVGEGKGEASGETGKVGAEKKGESGEGLQGMGGRGKLPPWAAQSHPQPPWILGSDAANLAMTRVAQRDIWAHQFPPGGDCSNERLLLVDWPSSVHGIGSQLHIMSAILSLAMRFKRVLVPSGGSFTRASHADCNATGTYASFHCYFFPLVSPACEYQAELAVAAAAAANETLPRMTEESKEGVLGSEQRVVWFHGEPYNGLRFEGDVSRWPNAYRERPNSIELVGFVGEGDETRQRSWGVLGWGVLGCAGVCWGVLGCAGCAGVCWGVLGCTGGGLNPPASPSAYLCHITNRVRHTSYGFSVAARLAPTSLSPSPPSPPHFHLPFQVHWWRAQSIRFLLRSPSAYLCHITNRVRHTSYGLSLAAHLAASAAHQAALAHSHPEFLSSLRAAAPPCISGDGSSNSAGAVAHDIIANSRSSEGVSDVSNSGSDAGNPSSSSGNPSGNPSSNPGSNPSRSSTGSNPSGNPKYTGAFPSVDSVLNGCTLESRAWAERRPNSCSCGSTDSTSETNTAGVTESSAFRRLAFGAEPYVPRPIVSVHVRQGDKGSEMQLNSFAAFMFFAYRLRRVEPELRHVWLSTEMQVRVWGWLDTCCGYTLCGLLEMQLNSFAVFMFFAYRLRRVEPELRHVWLSTEMQVRQWEWAGLFLVLIAQHRDPGQQGHVWLNTEMQSVIDQADRFKEWSFHISHDQRQSSNKRTVGYKSSIESTQNWA